MRQGKEIAEENLYPECAPHTIEIKTKILKNQDVITKF